MYTNCKKKGLAVFAFIVAMSGNLFAQELDTMIVRDINEVTVSARNTPRPLLSATPLQVLTGDKIKELGLQNVADAVRRFSGTAVRDYGGIGGIKTVSVRSLGAHHTAISYDDVAVSNCQAGQIDIGRFSLDNISVLSLVVGEDESLLNSARMSASAAVLSIHTEIPEFADRRNNNLRASIKLGSFGQVNPVLGYALKIKNKTVVSLSGDLMRADGTYPFVLTNVAEKTREKRNNSDVVSGHAEMNVYHTFRDNSSLTVKSYYFNSDRGLPGSIVLYNNINRERLQDENFFTQASYKKELSEKLSLQGQLKYNYSWNKYKDVNVKYEDSLQIDLNTQNEYYGSAAIQFMPSDELSFSVAQDVAVNTLRNNYKDCPFPTRYSSFTAFRVRYKMSKMTLSGTLLNTSIFETVKTGVAPPDKKRLTPSFSALYKPFNDYYFNLRALYKNTFRVPTFNDLYYLRVGNTALRPEKANEYNLGMTWSGTPFSFLDYITLTLDGYYNEVTDKIVAVPTTYVWKMYNYGKVRIYGMDVNLSTGFPITERIKISIAGSYTYQKAIDVTSSKEKNYKDQIPYTPKHSGNAALTVAMPWVNVAYTVVAVGERYFMKENRIENLVKGYQEHTFSLSRKFNIKHCKLSLQAECVNFTNEQYDIIKFYPMPGRSFRGIVRIEI
jgi:Outer membrane cobalamin receptor protein